MAELKELQSEIENLLNNAAKTLKIRKHTSIFDAKSAIRGGGFIGEFFLASIIDEETKKVHEVAIKKAFSKEQNRKEFNTRLAYECEILFYSKVFPAFKKFQAEKKGLKEPFTEVADFYYGTLEEYKEALVFENLKAKGYDMRAMKLLLDDELATLIFKTYAKFHALSFAFKDQHLEEYNRIMKNAKDFVAINFQTGTTKKLIDSSLEEAFEAMDSYPEIKAISEKYKTDGTAEVMKYVTYKGNGIITHGDCWCSNRLYKYSESGKLLGVKLIDFQLMREGTPVYDLSYFFYAGGSKELFKNLDHYLKIYHDSLSTNLKELGSDPEKLYPFKQLKEEWLHYGTFGTLMGICLAKFKLLDAGDVQEIVKDHEEGAENPMGEGFLSANINKDLFKERAKDIILHAYEIGILK